MNFYDSVRNTFTRDDAVSPVIAVILMVAITVVLAATVYVWVSGFASEDTGPEQASATARGLDLNDDGKVEWIRVTLTRADNAPYEEGDVTITGTDSDGASISTLYEQADTTGAQWDDGAGDTTWDVGESLFAPCSGDGNHAITASVRNTTILDRTLNCDQDESTT